MTELFQHSEGVHEAKLVGIGPLQKGARDLSYATVIYELTSGRVYLPLAMNGAVHRMLQRLLKFNPSITERVRVEYVEASWKPGEIYPKITLVEPLGGADA